MIYINNTMSIASINKILADGGNITFRKGVYKITSQLVLGSNSKITCESGVVFEKRCKNAMITTAVNSNTTKYTGSHDVTWTGGTIKVINTTASNVITIVHAKNITLKNIIFNNCMYHHFIEINSSYKVTVDGCTFSNHTLSEDKPHKEMIQIDYCYYGGLSFANKGSNTYDGTHCRYITITNNTFNNAITCIGTHTETTLDKIHRYITISNNKATARSADKTIFVKLINMQNVEISNNNISDFKFGIYYTQIKNGYNLDGTKGTVISEGNKVVNVFNNTYKNVNCEISILGE